MIFLNSDQCISLGNNLGSRESYLLPTFGYELMIGRLYSMAKVHSLVECRIQGPSVGCLRGASSLQRTTYMVVSLLMFQLAG